MQDNKSQIQQALVEQFKALDKDGSGKVDAEELLRLMPGIQKDGAANIIAAMEVDADGQIDLAEFLRFHLGSNPDPPQ